jgi:ESS family glutamate:Na+ symporter
MSVPVVTLNAYHVLGISCFGVGLGNWLKHRLPVLDRLNIPSSIVGGLIYALLTLLLRDRVVNFKMDLMLRDILMVAFFTTIGMGASLRLIKTGGTQVLTFFGIATLGAILQSVLGIGLAKLVGISPLLGIISGAVALTGGPATALAFGKEFEKFGVEGATAVGVASAMFGITMGGLMGGWIGGHLIQKHKLRAGKPAAGPTADEVAYAADPPAEPISVMADESEAEDNPLLSSVIAIAIAMGLGTLISDWLSTLSLPWDPSKKLVLPAYIGAMLAAATLRNLDDRFRFIKLSQHHIDSIGNIALYIFIVMALLTLELWQLATLAGPFFVLLIGQLILVFPMCFYLTFYGMGRDYEAAVMSGGFCGFMMGTTANAMACMDVISKKYGPAPRSFIVVPIVGAFLIDFTNALIITTLMNLFV